MIKFVPLDKENIDMVYELECLCFEKPWTKKMFEAELLNDISYYILAVDTTYDAAVGYVGVWLTYDFGDITKIAVHPDFRRNGIAKKLLDTVKDICSKHKINKICLEVNENNKSAIALYENYGFLTDGVRKKYYENKFDAKLMTYLIKEV